MKKKSLALTSLIIILLMCTSLLFACDFASWFKHTLETPTINLNATSTTISWKSVSNAETYDIYAEDVLIANTSEINYNFFENINSAITLNHFYIIAKAKDYNDSSKSNVITYLTKEQNEYEVDGVVSNNTENPVKNIHFDGNYLSWDSIAGINDYYVLVFSNNQGAQVVNVNNCAFDYNDYIVSGQILAFRVGIKNELDEVCFSSTVFYNDALFVSDYGSDAINFNKQMKNIYLFQGKYYDYYITSQDEMNVMVYYGFINRKTRLDVAISSQFYNKLYNEYKGCADPYAYIIGQTNSSGETMAKYPGTVGIALSSFAETCDIGMSVQFDSGGLLSKRHFIILSTYNGGVNPSLQTDKTMTECVKAIGYYDKVNYTNRSSDFNNFVSDKQLLVAYVESSEQLYFAVENHTTPLFNNTTSKAYELYNKAKQVLREIISDEMTDYEKVLSIFDWICINSVYDHISLNMPKDSPISFANYTAYYLEGVLLDGLAVCDGYSKTFSLLCNMEGINAVRIGGYVKSGNENVGHAWNKVEIDGSWYAVDITWSLYESESNTFNESNVLKYNSNEFSNHLYFLVSDEDISDHIPANANYDAKFPAPNKYYYYLNQTYNGVNNLVINSNADLNRIVKYMLENKIYMLDVAFNNIVYGAYTQQHTYPAIDHAISEALNSNKFGENDFILYLGNSEVEIAVNKLGLSMVIILDVAETENVLAA